MMRGARVQSQAHQHTQQCDGPALVPFPNLSMLKMKPPDRLRYTGAPNARQANCDVFPKIRYDIPVRYTIIGLPVLAFSLIPLICGAQPLNRTDLANHILDFEDAQTGGAPKRWGGGPAGTIF